MSEKRFKYFVVDGEDFIQDCKDFKIIDLCGATGEMICGLLNDLEDEKNCWKNRATHKVLI